MEANAADLKNKQETLAQTESLLLDAEEVKREFSQRVQMLEQQIVRAEARLGALQRLQNRLEGNEGLSAWIARHQLDALPRLWQHIQIEKGWEDALEAVLRERLNSVQLDQLDLAREMDGRSSSGEMGAVRVGGRHGLQGIPGMNKRMSLNDERAWILLQSYLSCDDAEVKPAFGRMAGRNIRGRGVARGSFAHEPVYLPAKCW